MRVPGPHRGGSSLHRGWECVPTAPGPSHTLQQLPQALVGQQAGVCTQAAQERSTGSASPARTEPAGFNTCQGGVRMMCLLESWGWKEIEQDGESSGTKYTSTTIVYCKVPTCWALSLVMLGRRGDIPGR